MPGVQPHLWTRDFGWACWAGVDMIHLHNGPLSQPVQSTPFPPRPSRCQDRSWSRPGSETQLQPAAKPARYNNTGLGSLTTDLVPASKQKTMAPSKCNIKRNIKTVILQTLTSKPKLQDSNRPTIYPGGLRPEPHGCNNVMAPRPLRRLATNPQQ